jgi:hypothetical protein
MTKQLSFALGIDDNYDPETGYNTTPAGQDIPLFALGLT